MRTVVFLSHSFKDASFVLAVKFELEGLGYSVYVDWIDDAKLDRSKVSKQTADLLRRRMKRCQSLFIVDSVNVHSSKWVPWELGFFDGCKDKAAILPLADSEFPDSSYYGIEYFGLYPYITKAVNQANKKETLWVHESENCWVHFDSWIAGEKPSFHERYTR